MLVYQRVHCFVFYKRGAGCYGSGELSGSQAAKIAFVARSDGAGEAMGLLGGGQWIRSLDRWDMWDSAWWLIPLSKWVITPVIYMG